MKRLKNRDLIAWLQQRDPEEQVSLAGSELARLVYADTVSDAEWAAECEEFGCSYEDPQVGDGTFLRQAVEHLEQRQRGT